MPYIPQKRRIELEETVLPIDLKAGDLNYIISLYLGAYVQAKGLSYQVINDIVGALESAKLEFYRRVAVPYEDQKLFENGDVYDKI